jgi:DNA-binding NtrC family response regulator
VTAAAKNHILVVDDDLQTRELIANALLEQGHTVTRAKSAEEALELLKNKGFHLVVTDVRMPGKSGMEVLAYVKENIPGTPVIVTTGYGSVDQAVLAMRQGAYDFQEKPINIEHLNHTIIRALRETALSNAFDYLRRTQPYIYKFGKLVAESDSMKRLLDQAAKIAASDITLLLTGETGTGKSMIAGTIHANSRRADHTLVTVNCAALPETLLESELFGHEKGAFTGADKNRIGRIQQAHGGTLFLDEVGDMSAAIQAKVLRAIEDQVIQPLGTTRSIDVDVRIISATNVDLGQAVADKTFRQDLFYRLGVATLHVPPLRERIEDVMPLARRFLDKICKEASITSKELSPQAERALLEHNWPGNVRELRSAIERAVLFSEDQVIEKNDLALMQNGPQIPASPSSSSQADDLLDLQEVEKNTILRALQKCDWVQNQAAQLLNISPRSLCYRIKKLGLGDMREEQS